MKPLCSVLINNFNNGPYIKDCVESALNQTYPNVEVIVYDDGSTDESLRHLEKFGNRIILLAAKENYGKSSNFNQMNAINKAFEVSKGEYIFLLDGDDKFAESKVERVIDEFVKRSDCCMVQHNLGEIDTDDNATNKIQPDHLCIRPLMYGLSYREYILKYHNQMVFAATSGLCFRRDFLEAVLPLKEDSYDMIWPDVRLTRKAIFFGEVYHIDIVLGYYRNHNLSWRNTERNQQKVVKQMYDFFNKLPEMKNRKGISYKKYKLKKWMTWFYLTRRLEILRNKLIGTVKSLKNL